MELLGSTPGDTSENICLYNRAEDTSYAFRHGLATTTYYPPVTRCDVWMFGPCGAIPHTCGEDCRIDSWRSFHMLSGAQRLADVGGEEAMLGAIADLLESCRIVVTFNGRCFDVPLLESRFVLSRLRPPFADLAHIDLLLAARRLYRRRLDSCRLAAVEGAILGVRRNKDIPGWAVPRLYFDYLHFGAAEPLAAVLNHNKLDVLSLVTLLARTGHILADRTPDDPGHCLALARWDEAQGRLTRAAELYRSTLERAPRDDDHAIALDRLLRIQRRFGRWDEMEGLLIGGLRRNLSARSRLHFLVELAKIKEHRRRDFGAAETLTREAISLREVLGQRSGASPLSTRGYCDLDLRLARIIRRRKSSASARSLELAQSARCHYRKP